MGESKRKAQLGAAIKHAVRSPVEEREELDRREKVKAELRRLMEVVDEGRFECMIVSELVDNTGTPKIMTNMIGDRAQIQAAAGNVVMHYSQKSGLSQAAKGMKFSLVEGGKE